MSSAYVYFCLFSVTIPEYTDTNISPAKYPSWYQTIHEIVLKVFYEYINKILLWWFENKLYMNINWE